MVEYTPEVVGGDRLEGAAVDGLGVVPADLKGDRPYHVGLGSDGLEGQVYVVDWMG